MLRYEKSTCINVGWLFWVYGPLRQYFSLYLAASHREGKGKERREKKCPNNPHLHTRWWSGGAMVLGKLPVPGRPTIWITVGQGPTALAVGAGGGVFGHF